MGLSCSNWKADLLYSAHCADRSSLPLWQGGLSSHSLILLLIFYFSNLEGEGGGAAAGARKDDIPADCLYGEWLLRVLEWLARFPFDTVVRAPASPPCVSIRVGIRGA